MAGPGVLRGNLDFRRYWIGQAASDLGTQLSLVAYPLLVLALPGTAAQAGAVASASLVACTACRLPAGHLADRWDRQRLMLAGDLVRAAAVGSLPVAAALGWLGFGQLLVVAAVEGAATALFRPAAIVAVRHLVPAEQLTEAMGRSHSRGAAAGLAGPALGGWLFTVHRMLPFAADAVSYLASAVLISRISTPLGPTNPAARADRRVSAGIRWLARHRTLRVVLGYAGVMNVVGAARVLVAVIALRQGGHSGAAIGLVLAGCGVGAVLGAAAAPALVRRFGGGILILALGAGSTVALAGLAVALSPWAYGTLLTLMSVLSPAAGIVVGRAMLTDAPDGLQGRVATAADLFMSGLSGLGPLLVGTLLGATGATSTWLLLALLTAVATAACAPMFLAPGFLAPASPASRSPSTASSSPAGPSSPRQSAPPPAAVVWAGWWEAAAAPPTRWTGWWEPAAASPTRWTGGSE
jgi:MFS family permease